MYWTPFRSVKQFGSYVFQQVKLDRETKNNGFVYRMLGGMVAWGAVVFAIPVTRTYYR